MGMKRTKYHACWTQNGTNESKYAWAYSEQELSVKIHGQAYGARYGSILKWTTEEEEVEA